MFSKRKILNVLISNSSISIIGLITGIVLARYMTVFDRGVLGVVLLWSSLAIAIGNNSIKDLIFSKKIKKEVNPLDVIFLVFIMYLVSLSMLVNGLFDYYWYFVILSPLSILTTVYLSVLIVHGQVVKVSYYKVITPFFYSIFLCVLLFFFELTVGYVLLAMLISNVILYLLLNIRETIVWQKSNLDWRSLFLVLSSVLMIAVNQQIDKVFISTLFDENVMANYLIALTICLTPLTIISQSMMTIIVPGIKSSICKLGYFDKLTFILLSVLIVLSIFIFYLSPLILPFVFGDKYNGALIYIPSALLFSSAITFRAVFFTVMRSLSFNKEILNFQFFSFVISLMGMITLTQLNLDSMLIFNSFGMVFLLTLVVIVLSGRKKIKIMSLESKATC